MHNARGGSTPSHQATTRRICEVRSKQEATEVRAAYFTIDPEHRENENVSLSSLQYLRRHVGWRNRLRSVVQPCWCPLCAQLAGYYWSRTLSSSGGVGREVAESCSTGSMSDPSSVIGGAIGAQLVHSLGDLCGMGPCLENRRKERRRCENKWQEARVIFGRTPCVWAACSRIIT